ncbi:MAG TPA: GxxExxY protein [Candidatus Angelobacter sp.]|jgi:GxxExxY protein|nr:GxxExxY protein [Candidatus Angelobacter sp.]
MNDASSDKKHWDLCHGIVEVFYAVYNELGHGFLEAVYEEALSLALTQAGFTVSRQVPTPIWFRGQKIGDYKADLIVNNSVLVELKTVRAIEPAHEAQVLNYLRATDVEVALLLNFGPKPSFKRFLFDNNRKGLRVQSRGAGAQ